ncbi:cysteine synthase [Tindallia magadiensis]|uniref:Cysteine synthase n=1 Tax=Tindallia magadiensis TaxID=69895 RepID=A0A1I3DD03_9FIRM|nr:cysteine synthase A [Tindallia magadiensis]SFH84449.1 cysteine synthase [Tindallia magadiensis]
MIASNITELIGKTPVVRLNRMTDKEGASVYLKLESMNPGGSVKDRAALNMILDAEEKGLLRPGTTIVEPTSGNTGIGLAMVAAAKGYKTIIIMPDSASEERIKLLKAYGAQVVLTPADQLMQGSINKANELMAAIPNAFMPDQFQNMANPEVHKKTTAMEIMGQMDGRLDIFVATAGTGGTISGVGEVLKDYLPDLKIYVVESKCSPVIAGGEPAPHKIVGTGPGFIPKTLNQNIYNEIMHVTDKEAIEASRALARKEGILCGVSTGAAVHIAFRMAQSLDKNKRVLAMAPDTGERYMSMGFFDEQT